MNMRLKKIRFEMLCVSCCFLLFLFSSGCGSSGSQGDDDSDPNLLNFSVQLINEATGSETDAISDGNPGILQITVTYDQSGDPAPGKLVTATPTKGSFSVAADGTDSTDGNGVAEIKLVAVNADGESVTGAGEISVQSGDYEMEMPFAFQIGVPDSTRLGAFIDGLFQGGVLSSSLAPGETLSYGGTALIVADLVDGEGNPFDQPATVQFASQCGATLTASLLTENGRAVCVYTSNGCSSTHDVVTATVLKGGTDLTAKVSIPLAQEATGSIESVSVEPSNIAVAGTATSSKPENSLVTFRVKDDKGNAMVRELVFFSLTTTEGGITVSPLSRETDENGEVTALVKSGTVATSVRVKALAKGTTISTLSGNISIEETPLSESIGSISLSSGSVIIPADGQSQVALRATVLNKSGLPMPAVDVDFSTTFGTLSSTTAWTRSDGIAEVQLQSISSGTSVITANAHGFLTNLSINFTPGASMNLSLEPAVTNDGTIQVGESIDYRAILRDSRGNPIPNEQINFAFLDDGNTSGASLSVSTGITNSSGIALVNYTAGDNPGVDWLGAIVDSNQSISNTARMEVIQKIVTVGSMVITADPEVIQADGASSSAITVDIKDIAGAPVPAGTEVTFSTTLGLFSNGGTTLTMETSDDSGSLTVSLISALIPGDAKVTAVSGGVSQSVAVTFAITIESVVGTIALTADPTAIPADGTSSSTINAVINDTTGSPIPQGQLVVFTTTLGTFADGSTRYELNTADDTGRVVTSLNAGIIPGFAVVTASAGGISQSVVVTLASLDASDVGNILIDADPTVIPANGGSSSTLSITISDTAGNPVSSGHPVYVSTDLGTFSNGTNSIELATTDDSGKLITSLNAGVTPGFALVTVTSGGVSQSVVVTISDINAPAVGSVTLGADPTAIPADGGSSSTLTVVALDVGGTPVPQGTLFYFSTDLGTFFPDNRDQDNDPQTQTLATIDDSGTLIASLIAGIIPGDAKVTAVSGGVSQSVPVIFEASVIPEVGRIDIDAEFDTLPADGSTSTAITVTVSDLENMPMPAGTPVTLTTTLGTFPGGIDPDGAGPISSRRIFSISGTNGQVLTSLIAPLSEAGTAVITATSGGVSQLLEITITVNGNGEVSLVASPTSIIADGASTATFTATVKDGGGNPVMGVPVVFKNLTGQDLTTVETNTFEGTTSTDTPLFTHSGGELTLTMTHAGSSNFIVVLYDTDGNYVDPIKNTIGSITEETTIKQGLPAGEYYLSVQADGSWTIKLKSELGGTVVTDDFDELPTLVIHLTNAAGQATYIYTSTRVAQAVTMGIKANDVLAVASIEQVAGSAASMSVSASPNPMHPGTQTTVTARIVDSNNNPVAGESVNFVLTTNNSGGLALDADATGAVTNLNGEASVDYTAGYSDPATDSITVTSGTFPEIVVDIDVDANAIVVGVVTLTSDKTQLPADGSSSAAITVSVFDINNVQMPSGTPIILTTTLGTFPGGVDPDGAGPITSRLLLNTTSASGGQIVTSLIAPLSQTGTAVITVISGGVSQLLNISIGDIGGPTDEVAAIALVAEQTSLNPEDTITITAIVYDTSGHGLSGQAIEFVLDDSTLGSITASGTTDLEGFDAIFEAGSSTGTVSVTAISNSVSSAPLEIAIKDQFVASITAAVNPTSITVTKTASVSAKVVDASNSPVPNASVSFMLQDTAFGTITSTAVTNAVGVASATFIAGIFPGTATIIVASGSESDEVDVEIQPAEAASIEFASVSINPIAVRGTGGQEFAIIDFNVKDVNGNPAEDVDVMITMVSGMHGGEYLDLDDGTPYIQIVGTSNGVAEVTLHSGYEAGTVSITASIPTSNGNTISVTTPIISIGGGVVTDEWFVVSVAEPGWNLGGLGCVGVETEITAWLADRFGNYNVLDGHTVSFQSEVGLSVKPIGVTGGATGAATTTIRTQGVPKDVVPETWEVDLIAEMKTDFSVDIGDPLPSGHPRDGVCNVLVFTIGEESFVDGSNSNLVNGVYDDFEDFVDTVDDPWRDYDDDGEWDDGTDTTNLTTSGATDPSSGIDVNPEEDEYQDREGNNVWDGENTVWDGNKSLFRQVDFLITGLPNIRMDKDSFTVANGGSDTVKILICDDNYNPLSAGSTYTVSVDAGKITGGVTSYEYPSSSFYGSKTTTDWDSDGDIDDDVDDYLLAHRNLIVNEITISDDDSTTDEETSASLTITVTWKSNGSCADVVRTLTIPGTVDYIAPELIKYF